MTNKGKILFTILLVIIVVLLVYVFLIKSATPETFINTDNNISNPVSETNADQTNGITITVDPKDPNVSIYTSDNLGVEFSYLNNGTTGLKSKPVEAGNTISLDSNNYIKVIQKTTNKSVVQTIKDFFPEEFKNEPNCSVVADGVNKYLIWDKRIPVSARGSDSFDGSPYQNLDSICGSKMDNDFIVDPNFSNVIYYVQYSHQSFDYAADASANPKPWFTTVHLIKVSSENSSQNNVASEWKTYSYKNITFKYPSDWTIDINGDRLYSQVPKREQARHVIGLSIYPLSDLSKKWIADNPKSIIIPATQNYEEHTIGVSYDIVVGDIYMGANDPEEYYPKVQITNGVNFSLGNGSKFVPELETIFNEIVKSVKLVK